MLKFDEIAETMLNQNFVLLGVLIEFLGGFSYIKETVQGKIQPNRVSWGLWSLSVFVAFFAEINQGVGILSLATLAVGITPFFIFWLHL